VYFTRILTAAHRDLKVLGRLAVVPGLIASVIALLVLIFAFLSSTDSRHVVVPWLGTALGAGTVAAIALGWFSKRVRSGSTLTIGSAALTFSLGALLLVVWRNRAGEPAIVVVLTAFLPTILAVSSWWALHIARRLHSRFPELPSRPHATRRLSLPRDARALRAVGPALRGGLDVLLALLVVVALAPLLRQHPYLWATSISCRPPSGSFAASAQYSACAHKRFVSKTGACPFCCCDRSATTNSQ
jgi:hypothetical protein